MNPSVGIEGEKGISAEEVIDLLDLKPLRVEGGFFRETYRSPEEVTTDVLSERYDSSRTAGKAFSTAIYYLLTPETFSTLHRLPTDEVYHFYLGDPVIMLQLHRDGSSDLTTLGHELGRGQKVQVVVPHGTWHGSFLEGGGRFVLLGTTMAPGFDFSDYEPGDRASLIMKFPDRSELIERLTKP